MDACQLLLNPYVQVELHMEIPLANSHCIRGVWGFQVQHIVSAFNTTSCSLHQGTEVTTVTKKFLAHGRPYNETRGHICKSANLQTNQVDVKQSSCLFDNFCQIIHPLSKMATIKG